VRPTQGSLFSSDFLTDSIKLGRRRKLDAEMVRVAAERYAKGQTMAELADVYGVSEPTIWRALQ